jgi:hypothetical protein
MACTIIRRTSIIMLTPNGWLLPLIPAIIPPIGIPMLVPRALITIPAVGIAAGLIPLTVLAIPTIGLAPGLLPPMRLPIPAVIMGTPLLPLTIMAIPTIGMATHLLPLMRLSIPAVIMGTPLLPLTVLAIPTIGMATHLLPLMRLPIPAVSRATPLGRGESRTIWLPAKGTIRSGLGAQRAQSHKQTQGENDAPPDSWSHFIILL